MSRKHARVLGKEVPLRIGEAVYFLEGNNHEVSGGVVGELPEEDLSPDLGEVPIRAGIRLPQGGLVWVKYAKILHPEEVVFDRLARELEAHDWAYHYADHPAQHNRGEWEARAIRRDMNIAVLLDTERAERLWKSLAPPNETPPFGKVMPLV